MKGTNIGSASHEILMTHTSTAAPNNRAPPSRLMQLAERVRRDLSSAWNEGLDIMVQMVAQELCRRSKLYEGEHGRTMRVLAEEAVGYLDPTFEIGVILTDKWRSWLNALVIEASEVDWALEMESRKPPDMNENDVMSLMGMGSTRGDKGQRRNDDQRDRREERDRSRQRARRDRDHEGHHRHEHGEHEDQYRCEPPWRRRSPSVTFTTSTRGAPATSSTPPAATTALTMSRHTWRCLLGMQDEGPGGNDSEAMDRPIDEIQSQNILATVEDLTAAERLAFLGSLTRFLMEISHQVNQLMLTGASTASEDPEEGAVLMQTSLRKADQARVLFGTIQRSLEGVTKHKCQKARTLHHRVQSRYINMPSSLIPTEAEELMAVLVVFAEENHADCGEVPTDEDFDWTRTWWNQMIHALEPLDEKLENGLTRGDGPSIPTASCAIDLDTPPPEPSNSTILAGGIRRGQGSRGQRDPCNGRGL